MKKYLVNKKSSSKKYLVFIWKFMRWLTDLKLLFHFTEYSVCHGAGNVSRVQELSANAVVHIQHGDAASGAAWVLRCAHRSHRLGEDSD